LAERREINDPKVTRQEGERKKEENRVKKEEREEGTR
jgi:hypothetical protein